MTYRECCVKRWLALFIVLSFSCVGATDTHKMDANISSEEIHAKKQSITDLFPKEASRMLQESTIHKDLPLQTPDVIGENLFFRGLSLISLLGLLGLSYLVFTSWKKKKALRECLEACEKSNDTYAHDIHAITEKAQTIQQTHTMLLGYLHKEMLVINELIQSIHGDEKELLHVTAKEHACVIENFSDIAQMDDENFEMNAIEFNIHEILQSIAYKLKTEMLTTHTGVVFKVDTGLQKFFTGDMVRLENMLLSLLKFLLKGTHEGVVSLNIKQGKKETSGKRLLFTISCNAERFDDSHYELLDAILHKTNSLGVHTIDTIALMACKAYVEKMGGVLSLVKENGIPVLTWECYMELSQREERRKFRPLYKDIMHARTVIVDPNMIGVGVLRSELEYSKIPLGLFFTWESALKSFEQNGEVDLFFINADYLATLLFDEVDMALRRYCCKVILVCYKQPHLPSSLQMWMHQIGAYVLEHPYTHEQLLALLDRIYSENADFQANVSAVSLRQD